MQRIKQFTSILVSLMLILGGMTLSTSTVSADETSGDYTYTVTAGEVTITGYTGLSKDIDIPTKIDNKPVTAIGDNAFSVNDLTSVIIPDSVTTIGASAFNNNNLTSVTIGQKVTTIGDNAFSDNELTRVTIPAGVTSIGVMAFAYNKDSGNHPTLTKVAIYGDSTIIGDDSYDVFLNSTVPDFRLFGFTDSTAEAYATNAGYNFVAFKKWTAVEDIPDQNLTGAEIEPTVVVKDGATELIEGTDYTVTYVNNINSGIATAMIKGISDYDFGEDNVVTKEFKIIGPKLAATASITNSLYGYDDIKASWKKVSGASGYYVYCKKSTSKNYTYKGTTTGLSKKIGNLTDGAKYYVRVVPYGIMGKAKYTGASKTSSAIYTLKKMSTPKVAKKSSSKVTVGWTNIAGESGYQISKSTSKPNPRAIYGITIYTVKTTTGKSKVISAMKGKTYYYKIRAYKKVGSKKIVGPWSNAQAYKIR